MSRLLTDGFEGRASMGQYWAFDTNWSFQTGTWQTITPFSGSYMLCCNVNDNSWHEIERRQDSPVDVLIARLRFCCHDRNTSELRLRWGDLPSGEWGSLFIDSDGGKGHVTWGTLDVDIPVVDFSWAADTWYIVEIKAEHSIGGGQSRITVRVDTTQVYTNSGNWGIVWTGIDRFTWARNGENSAAAWAVDDLTLNSDAGAQNNSWIGATSIARIYPIGPGAYTELLPSGGSIPSEPHWSLVDEAPPVDLDRVYGISGGSLGVDTYEHSDLAFPGALIQNVVVEARGRTMQPGVGWWRGAIYINGTLYTGGSLAMPGYWKHHQWTFYENPDTSAPWFMGDTNGAEFGIELLE